MAFAVTGRLHLELLTRSHTPAARDQVTRPTRRPTRLSHRPVCTATAVAPALTAPTAAAMVWGTTRQATPTARPTPRPTRRTRRTGSASPVLLPTAASVSRAARHWEATASLAAAT